MLVRVRVAMQCLFRGTQVAAVSKSRGGRWREVGFEVEVTGRQPRDTQ